MHQMAVNVQEGWSAHPLIDDMVAPDFLEKCSGHDLLPTGSTTTSVRYSGPDGVERFTERLVREAGVLLLPASVYRSDLNPVPDDHFRIGFGRKEVEPGLAALRGWIQRNRS